MRLSCTIINIVISKYSFLFFFPISITLGVCGFDIDINNAALLSAALVSDTLKALNVSINLLPQQCQELLYCTEKLQNELKVQSGSPISLLQTQSTLKLLKVEYEVLELKQENMKLQKKICLNMNFLECLRAELEESRRVLDSQNPNGNIHEFLTQTEKKMASYEEIYEEVKVGKLLLLKNCLAPQ